MDVYDLIKTLSDAGSTDDVCVVINGKRYDISHVHIDNGYAEISIVQRNNIDGQFEKEAGYRKASEVIDEFVERVKERLEEFTKQDYEDGVPYYHADCEQIDNVIDDVADEMRQEVEK